MALGFLAATAALAACSSATRSAATAGQAPAATAGTAPTKFNPGRYPHTAADVHFMSGMIPHHAQAVLIAGWAPSHGARQDVRLLCERIVVGQRDEIGLMQNWLRDAGEPVPEATATHLRMTMNGMQHDMLMPGMLNEEELAALDRARGSDFDRLFLQAMIKHHMGAITMVDELFNSRGAGQDEIVFRFASDVYADQTTEVERMQKMLAATPGGGGGD
jgi:uncharacterized protein (DUF305 family)